MARIYVIKTGQTTFEEAQRVESSGGEPLTPAGIEDVKAAARQLASEQIDGIYASTGEAERQTATLTSEALELKVHMVADLREIDYGLWQGLTTKEIQRRQPKVYRQWTEAPMTICPPGGETLEQAHQRLRQAVNEILKRQKVQVPLLVLRPVALELVRSLLESKSPEGIWDQMDPTFKWGSYDVNPKSVLEHP